MCKNLEKPKECFIIGGGTSIQEGIDLGLKEKLKDKFVIVCNYAYKHFPHTILACVDYNFYVPQQRKNEPNYPDIYEELKKEPLIITTASLPKELILPNTICVKGSGHYKPNPLKNGFFTPVLCGIFALSLAEFLEFEIIYLFGFDWTIRPNLKPRDSHYKGKTNLNIHYYQKEIQHRGVGYVGFYENHNPNYYFQYFENSKSKIYNVSPKSTIQNFIKISYSQMFMNWSLEKYNPEEIKTYIKSKLIHIA